MVELGCILGGCSVPSGGGCLCTWFLGIISVVDVKRFDVSLGIQAG
jgi:hypothetical protein